MQEDLIERRRIKLLLQGGGCVECFDLAIHHDADSVAILRLVHVVGRDEHRDTPIGRPIDQLPELTTSGRIHTPGRLIEKDNLGIVEDALREGEPLFPSQRLGAHQRIPFSRQSQLLQQQPGFLPDRFTAQPVDASKQS